MIYKNAEVEDASTVILVREHNNSLQVYMTQRQHYLSFMGGYYVFPGGKVDEIDRSDDIISRCRSFTPDQAKHNIVSKEGPRRAFGYYSAGIRELYEEAGVLLAETADGVKVESKPGSSECILQNLSELREEKTEFIDILQDEDLYISPEKLLWLSHWVTPATSPRRFSTYFFLAKMPDGQETDAFENEVAKAFWVSANEAIDNFRNGKWSMIPPTLASLDVVARYSCWKDIEKDFSLSPQKHKRTIWTGDF
jgi:8-oxo-dGTP pyrophosphatase MutT (NUDIX family)